MHGREGEKERDGVRACVNERVHTYVHTVNIACVYAHARKSHFARAYAAAVLRILQLPCTRGNLFL